MIIKSKLDEREIKFLKTLSGGKFYVKDGVPCKEILSLIQRGYCRTSEERIFFSKTPTGNVCINITEAGKTCLELSEIEHGTENKIG